MMGVEHGGPGRLYSCLDGYTVSQGESLDFNPNLSAFKLHVLHLVSFFPDLNFLTSEIIQTLQKGIKGILLPPPSPITQAHTAPSLVGALPGCLLCMNGAPKETSGMTISSPDRTAVTAEAGLRSELSSSLHDQPG